MGWIDKANRWVIGGRWFLIQGKRLWSDTGRIEKGPNDTDEEFRASSFFSAVTLISLATEHSLKALICVTLSAFALL